MTSTPQQISPQPHQGAASEAVEQKTLSTTGSNLAASNRSSFPSTASKPSSTPNASGPYNMSAAVGGHPSHAHGDSVNGRNSTIPAMPSPVINGNNSLPSDHTRKPSMTVTPAGVTGFTPNGGAVGGAQNKANSIQFGSVNAGGSPAMTQPALAHQSAANLGVNLNPRIASPSKSPSPIPQPSASGGRPPSTFQGHGNGLSFGQIGGEGADPNNPPRPMSQMQFGPQQEHMRRGSSQSDMSANLPSGPGRGGYPAQGGRGRGYPAQYQHHQQMTYSPNQNFRPAPNGRGMQPSYQGRGQQHMPFQASPNLGTRSPAMLPTNPGTPQMNQMHMVPGMQGQPNGYYMGSHQGYGVPTQADPSISIMYNQQFYGMPGMQGQYPNHMPPQSPRPPYQQNAYAPHMQPTYSNQSQGPQPMSRQSSQMSMPDRPGSSIGQQSHTPAPAAPSQSTARTPSISAPRSNFTLPTRKSAAIQIKNAAGEVVSFNKSATASSVATPPVAPAASPALPTPPSRTGSAADNAHRRTDSVNLKSDEEKKRAMQEAVAKRVAEDQAKTKQDKEAGDQKTEVDTTAAEHDEQVATEAKEAKEAVEIREPEATNSPEPNASEAVAEVTSLEAADKDGSPEPIEEDDGPGAADEEKATVVADVDSESESDSDSESEPTREVKSEAGNVSTTKSNDNDVDFDALEAEYAAMEAEEARREEEYQKKKNADKETQQKKEAEEVATYEANMKELERKAEEEELAREKERNEKGSDDETAKKMFASLKAEDAATPASADSPSEQTPAESGTATPVSDISMPPPSRAPGTGKRGKTELTLDTKKPVEPPEPSATLKSLASARRLEDPTKVSYPDGVSAPDTALNANAPADRRFKYDKEFLLQFQNVFKEKPSLDWDAKIRDALGDGDSTASARAGGSARTPSGMGGRSVSNRPAPAGNAFTPMGAFGGSRAALPPGTTSEQRFAASNAAITRGPMAGNPFAQFGRPGQMGPPTGRTPSNNPMAQLPGSPRVGGPSRGGSRAESKRNKHGGKQTAEENRSMPLTVGMNLGALEVSSTGWKPRSVGQSMATGPALGDNGYLEADVVQRKVKAALNKMTPEKFEKIADQVLEIAAQSKHESDGRTLRQVIQLTFEKATDEAHWAPMYAMFCRKMLESMSSEIKDENIKDKNGAVVTGGNLFRKYLLNRCQEEFERGWKVNLPPRPEGETEEAAMLSDEYYIAAAAKRRGLGLVRFIGELFKLQMLTERIMHECVKKLVDYEGIPDEAEVESLTSLLRTIGKQLDSSESKAQGRMDVYFERINQTISLPELPSRLRFMLMDIVDLRRKGWVSKEDSKGPKTIQEIHLEAERAQRDAEMARLASQAGGRGGGGRMPAGRGDARNFSGYGQVPPPDNSNRVGTDDLRRLGNRATRNTSSAAGPGSLGPPSLLAGRTNSGRRGLGPGSLLARGDDSNASSRTGTPPAPKDKEKKDEASTNAFSALAALDGEGPASPPSNPSSPPTQKSQPSIERERSRSPEKSAD